MDRGVEQLVAREAHNLEVIGSSPVPATLKAVSFETAFFISCFVSVHERPRVTTRDGTSKNKAFRETFAQESHRKVGAKRNVKKAPRDRTAVNSIFLGLLDVAKNRSGTTISARM